MEFNLNRFSMILMCCRKEREKKTPGPKRTTPETREMRYLQQLLYLECETSKSVTLNPSHFHHFMLLHDKMDLPNNIFEDILTTFHQRTQHFCKQIDEMSM